jgi:small subunit ribosomal protein S20
VEEAIASGDKAAAAAALKEAEPVLARTAQKGLVHRKTAAQGFPARQARQRRQSA